jgi:pimeloyl-ACP methyl ester carboxylesterase
VPFAITGIAGHDREDEVLPLLGILVLSEVELGVVALIGEEREVPAQVPFVPLGELRRVAGEKEDATDDQGSPHHAGDPQRCRGSHVSSAGRAFGDCPLGDSWSSSQVINEAGAPVFVLIHSPLVGPGIWRPVAVALERQGRRAVSPSLLGPNRTAPSDWRECVKAARDGIGALSEPVVLVGHSGGGLLLPLIADALLQPVRALIFVDSGIPARTGETPFVPPGLLDEFASLAVGGILPRWSSWFGEEAMHALVPDEALRDSLTREMPQVPLAFLDQRIPSPAGWERTPCAYLLLSDAYEDSATQARERGWPVEVIEEAQHLHLAVAPDAVTDALLRLERQALRSD